MTKRLDRPSAAAALRVLKRDRFLCAYCGVAGTEAELEVDHIVPVSKGGSHHIANLTTSCRACNQKKGNRDMSPTRSNRSSGDLVGFYVLTFDVDGGMHRQGEIVRHFNGKVAIQLFSWLDGRDTIVEFYDEDFAMSNRCLLFPTSSEMRLEADKRSVDQFQNMRATYAER